MARIRIGDLLVKAGLIDEMQLNAGLAHQRQWGGKLGDALVSMGFLDEMMLWRGLSKQLGVPLANLPEHAFPPGIERTVPGDLARKHSIVPLARDERLLTLATSEPNNIGGVDEVAFRAGSRLRVLLAPDREIEWAQRRLYSGDPSPCPTPRLRRVVAEPEPAAVHAPGPVFDAGNLGGPVATPMAEIAASTRAAASFPPASAMPASYAATLPSTGSLPPGMPAGMMGGMTGGMTAGATHGMAMGAGLPSAGAFAAATAPGAYGAPAAQPMFPAGFPGTPSLPPGFAGAASAAAMATFGPAAAPAPAPPTEAMLRETGQVLRVLIEACIQRGIFTREEFLARVRAQS